MNCLKRKLTELPKTSPKVYQIFLPIIPRSYRMPNKDVHLIDGSHWRWPTPLQLLIDNGEQGFITKATEGTRFVDDYYDDWKLEAEGLGFPFGSFHYWRAAYDPQKQAQHYYAIATAGSRPLFPPILDVEKVNNTGVLSTSAASAHLQVVALETEQLWGEKPWIYTSYYSVKDLLGNPSWLGEYPLWVASWRNDRPSIPVPWAQQPAPQYKLRQDTSTWPIPGSSFSGYDGDWWHGDQASYDAFVASRLPAPPPVPEPFPFMGKVSLAENLNIFNTPMGEKTGLLPDQTAVTILEEVRDAENVRWYKLGGDAFVKAKYIIPME